MTGVDLHPDDLAARIDVRVALRQRRHDRGLSAEAVSRRAGFAYASAVRDLEDETSWETWRVQQWARGLDEVLRLHIDGVEIAADDTASLVLKAATPFGGFDEDQLHLQVVAADLIRTRKAMGVTRSALARRCGVGERALRGFENSPLKSLLRIYQRYGRALGGAVRLDLDPVAAAVPFRRQVVA